MKFLYSTHHTGPVWDKNIDECDKFVCVIEEINLETHMSKSTDVWVCPDQRTVIFRHSDKPDDYTSGLNMTVLNTVDKSIRNKVFAEILDTLLPAPKVTYGYYGCEVHMKPEGRCPTDEQQCSFSWYD